MKNQILKIYKNPLFSGSAVMIIGSNVANVFAYVFHLVIGRMLGPVRYGEFASIISLVGLFSLTFGFLGLVIVKFVSGMKENELSSFYSWTTKRILIASAVVSLVVLASSKFLSDFLGVSVSSLLISAPLLFVLFLGFIYTSFLQGTLRFGRLVISSNVSLFGRLVLGVLFVYLGFSVFGALLGVLVSSIIGLLISIYFLRDIWKGKKNRFKFAKSAEVFSYAVPIFIMSLATNSLYMTDVVLVKHFLNPHLAGIYASLSTLGKILFYGTAPIAAVMFPLVSKSFAKGGNYKKVFLLSLLLTLVVVVGLICIYWVFPKFVLEVLYGNKFLEGAPYLVWFGIFIGIFSVDSLLLNYFLAKGSTKVTFVGLLAAVLQIVGISFFHKDLMQVIWVSIWVSLALLMLLLIYFWYETRFDSNSGLQGRKSNR